MDTLIARTTEQLNAQPAVESTAVELGESQIEVRSQGFGETLVVLSGVGAEVSYLGGFGGVSLCLVRLSASGRGCVKTKN